MKKTYIILSIVTSILLSISTNAQIDNTMYYMDRLPQANYINTSTVPDCKFYFSGLIVPILGQLPPPITFALNTPFDYNDFIFHGQFGSKDSLITPLHPDANLDDFLKKMKKINYFSTDFQLTLASFGFKQGKKNFWTFDASERMYFHFGLPGNLIKFPILGNGEIRDADFSGLHMNLSYYHQFAFGFKRQVTKYFNFGVRVKYLVGVANYYTSRSDLVFNTADKTNYLSTTANYVIHTNAPVNVGLNEDGFIEDIEFLEFNESEITKYVLFTGNRGYALDAGFSKDWNSELTYYVNIEDFGFINWKTNTHTVSLIGDENNGGGFEYRGIEMTDFNFSEIDILPNTDTLISKFDFNYSQESYRTPLPFKVYGGLRYKITPKFYFGLLGRFEKLTFGYRPSYTASANFRPFKFGQLTFSYSYINRNFNNIGLGYTTRIGPIQWFFVSDNLIGTIIFPDNSRSMSMRMGCNFIFINEKDKPKRKLPMFNSNNNYTNRKIPKFGEITNKSIYKKKRNRYKSISAPQN